MASAVHHNCHRLHALLLRPLHAPSRHPRLSFLPCSARLAAPGCRLGTHAAVALAEPDLVPPDPDPEGEEEGDDDDAQFVVVTFYKFVPFEDPHAEVASHLRFLQPPPATSSHRQPPLQPWTAAAPLLPFPPSLLSPPPMRQLSWLPPDLLCRPSSRGRRRLLSSRRPPPPQPSRLLLAQLLAMLMRLLGPASSSRRQIQPPPGPMRTPAARIWFVGSTSTETAYLLLYVDDIILTASSQTLLQQIIQSLQQEFAMKDLGTLHHFLGVTVEPHASDLFLHQRQYALDILERAGMTNCKPCSTPVDTQAKLSADGGAPLADPTAYRSLAGALQHHLWPYAIQQRLLRYVRGTVDYGLVLHRAPSTELVVYTDADWAGCPDTRRSTSGYAVFLGGKLVSWSSKCQPVVSRSSTEAEYRAVANGVAEASRLRQLLTELYSPLLKSTLVYCDNGGALYLSTNPVQHQRTKHVEIDLHFVRDRVAVGHVRVLHVPTTSQFADIFTKGLPSSTFLEFRSIRAEFSGQARAGLWAGSGFPLGLGPRAGPGHKCSSLVVIAGGVATDLLPPRPYPNPNRSTNPQIEVAANRTEVMSTRPTPFPAQIDGIHTKIQWMRAKESRL
nr:unnamed protein product [Digitaria exilis]